MRLSALQLLLLASSVTRSSAFGDDHMVQDLKASMSNMPAMIRDNVKRFQVGTKQMWLNGKAAGVVRRRVERGGEALSYAELQLLRRSGEDTFKLLRAGAMWLVAPELFPVLLYFYPRALPSTFETETDRERRRGTLARMRTAAALELLSTLEEQKATNTGRKALAAAEQCEAAELLLRAKSSSHALAFVQGRARALAPEAKIYKHYNRIAEREAQKRRPRKDGKVPEVSVGQSSGLGKAALMGLSQPVLKAGCKLIGVSGPQPGMFRRGALGAHLEGLALEDSILAAQGTSVLGREELVEACLDRGFGSTALNDAQLRRLLDEWLHLVRSRGDVAVAGGEGVQGALFEPHRLRLAAMAACATAAVRREADSMSVLPRLVYARS